MSLLAAEPVLALDAAVHSPLVRLLASLGAEIRSARLDALTDAQLSAAGLLVEFAGAGQLASRGWSMQRLADVAPRLIHVSVTTFGSDGPRADWRGGELIASAMGGVLGLTGPVGRPPVKEAQDACGYHAQMVAAAGAMAALHERSVSGRGQLVDVSVQEVAFSRQFNSVLSWQFDRRKIGRAGQGDSLNYGLAVVRCIWPLRDGWCFHSLMTGRFGAPANQALSDWMDEAGVANPLRGVDWLKYDRSRLDPVLRGQWNEAIAAFFASRSKRDIEQEGRRRGINAAVVADPADVLASPQLAARGFWRTDAAGRREPSRFVSIAAQGVARQAPPAARAPAAPVRGPLSGVRVLDFSWALVGSLTTKTLGDLGAQVIKVESRTRPCLTRLDVQVKASRHGNFDDKPWFAHLNTSKQSLALDMKKPESREILMPLVEWADVVVENFSPGTLQKLGLDYAALRARNPGVILVSGSVFGQSGPLAQEWGVDGTGGALSGRTFLTGWPDGGPVIPGAVPYGDVIVPYVMAAAVPAALAYRRAHGTGMHLDASMLEICVQQMREALLAAQDGGTPERAGNADPAVFHQGVYAVEGAERYVAIELRERAEWERLCQLTVLPPTDVAEGAASPARREALLIHWCRGQSGEDLVRRLQALHIGAGLVQDIEDLMEHDPQLKFRGALLPLPHPLLGEFGHLRTPLHLSRTPVQPFRAPSMGEHSHAIARELAGLSDARVAELDALGVFT